MADKEMKEEIVEEIINDTDNIEIASQEDEIKKLKTEVEDWKNSYLRKQAEFQNFTKRKEKEFDDLKAFASEKVVIKVLDIIDNLETV